MRRKEFDEFKSLVRFMLGLFVWVILTITYVKEQMNRQNSIIKL